MRFWTAAKPVQFAKQQRRCRPRRIGNFRRDPICRSWLKSAPRWPQCSCGVSCYNSPIAPILQRRMIRALFVALLLACCSVLLRNRGNILACYTHHPCTRAARTARASHDHCRHARGVRAAPRTRRAGPCTGLHGLGRCAPHAAAASAVPRQRNRQPAIATHRRQTAAPAAAITAPKSKVKAVKAVDVPKGGAVLDSYQKALDDKPIFTKACTSGVGFAVRDVLTQLFIEKMDFDLKRLRPDGVLRFFVARHDGPLLLQVPGREAHGHGAADGGREGRDDQTCWAPVFMVMFFSHMMVFEGTPDLIEAKIRQDVFTAVKGSWMTGSRRTVNFGPRALGHAPAVHQHDPDLSRRS